ncbi:MAG: hypothetical protein LBD69_04135 [Puniceicoccales bacterium]|jgi:hypothetical protein|nr:hypothetical protein [Puniceicoccales bacterium]
MKIMSIKRVFIAFLFCTMPFMGNAAVDLSDLVGRIRDLGNPSLSPYVERMQLKDPVVQAQAVKEVRPVLSEITDPKIFKLIRELDDAYIALLMEKVCGLEDELLPGIKCKLTNPGERKRGIYALILSNKNIGINLGFAAALLEDRPHVILKQKAIEYFTNKLGDSLKSVSFMEKGSGDQAGNIVRITLRSEEILDYYTKTHLGGLKSGGSNSVKPVDVRELFVYKFLERSGLGPEVHFFWDDLENFYIATKDAGDGGASFATYDQVRNRKELGGVANYRTWNLTSEDEVNPMIIEALVMADIVGRIFGLSDLITNSGNIGFICNDNQITAYKIIDFSFGRISRSNTIFPGFLGGNDVRFYLGANDKIVNYFLGTPAGTERIEVAKEKFKPRMFLDAIDAAEKEVQSLGLDSTLAAYVGQVKANVNAFASGLQSM